MTIQREKAERTSTEREAVLTMIGQTPLILLQHNWIKCEFVNPSGSIKARVAKHLIEVAEQRGLIRPGHVIVEATSGNMGNALAMVAAVKGYQALVLMPQGFSPERAAISRAYGAEVRLIGDFHLTAAIEEAKRIGAMSGYFCLSQFDNPENIEENRTLLATEILAQLPRSVRIDAIVQGVGTGGTLIGTARAFREHHQPNVKVIAVEPAESPTIQTGRIGRHQIEGISDGFVPRLFADNRSEVDEVISVSSADAIACMRFLATTYGLFVGPSSGANWMACKLIRDRYPDIRHILTFFCDEGEKYIQEHFSS